tara:strand:- start:118 stop:747 length:630 start_codon:yes stop_codon:yes gene_type:complete
MKKEDLEILREYREKENQKIYAPHFIGEYKNALTNKFCDLLVNFADRVVDGSGDSIREDPESYGHANYRKDWALFINDDPKKQRIVNEALDACLKNYTDEYMGVYYSGKVISIYQKLQVSPPTGGFHGWHCEHSGFESMERVLAWMFYLNDMPDGEGETEFLHQRCRIKPEKGKCVIFPASFTHTHRANPPLTQNKYILTGWWNLAQIA